MKAMTARPHRGGEMNAIERLKALEAKATPGPWRTETHGRKDDATFGVHYLFAEHSPYPESLGSGEQEDGFRSLHGCAAPLYGQDAALIVALRNAAPAMLRVIEAAQAVFAAMNPGGEPQDDEVLSSAIYRVGGMNPKNSHKIAAEFGDAVRALRAGKDTDGS